METALNILNIVLKVLLAIVLGVTALLSLAMAYIMFAPDEMPKPFRLVYQFAGNPPNYLPPGVLPPLTTPTPEVILTPTVEVKPGEGLMVNMSTKIINLSDPSGRKYIRLTVVLEFVPDLSDATSKSAEGGASTTSPQETEINARMPLMDDMVITILSTKSYEELYTADGKEVLRKEILEAIQQRLPELHLLSVYFTEFVVQ